MSRTALLQTIVVRYYRKPIWMPTAPSKLFRIPDHKFYSPDELKQIRLLDDAYHAQMASLQEYARQEFYIPANQTGGLPKEFIDRELEDERVLIEENDRENARIGKLKQEAINLEIDELADQLMAEKMKIEEKLLDIGQTVDEYIRNQKADPDSFVTEENIDRCIEKAMSNPISFTFCIDKSGRRHGGTPDSSSASVTS